MESVLRAYNVVAKACCAGTQLPPNSKRDSRERRKAEDKLYKVVTVEGVQELPDFAINRIAGGKPYDYREFGRRGWSRVRLKDPPE